MYAEGLVYTQHPAVSDAYPTLSAQSQLNIWTPPSLCSLFSMRVRCRRYGQHRRRRARAGLARLRRDGDALPQWGARASKGSSCDDGLKNPSSSSSSPRPLPPDALKAAPYGQAEGSPPKLGHSTPVYMYMYVCARAFARAFTSACVRACVRV